jgi:5'-phosphate synthase pdxT subunit
MEDRSSRPASQPPASAGRTIGVLALQGDIWEHLDHLERIGIDAHPVRGERDFSGLAGLILPGGESTCLSRLLRIFGLDRVIIQAFRQGVKLWGTCAGTILLAKGLAGEEPHLGLIDILVARNSFGSQLDSFACEARVPRVSSDPIPLTFIRAPKILSLGDGVEPLLGMADFIAAAESPDVLVTVFHPELTPSLAFHRYFARKCGLTPLPETAGAPAWNRTSWTRLARIG